MILLHEFRLEFLRELSVYMSDEIAAKNRYHEAGVMMQPGNGIGTIFWYQNGQVVLVAPANQIPFKLALN